MRTCKHEVLSEERHAEKASKYGQRGAHSRECLCKPAGLCAEAGEGAYAHDAMRVATQNIVLPGIQLCRLHQLKNRKGRVSDFICVATSHECSRPSQG